MILKPTLNIKQIHRLVSDKKIPPLTLIGDAYSKLNQHQPQLQAFRSIGEVPSIKSGSMSFITGLSIIL
jgi:hypothetical protein